MATSEEIKNALIGQLATFNGSSTEAEAMASENIGKIYVPTDEDVIIINKRRVGCGRNATTEKDGLMSATDKEALESVKTDIDDLQRAVGENIPNTYATKEEVETDFTAVNNSLAIASSTATDALGKANDAKGKVDKIIDGTTVVPKAQNAQEAQKATQDGSGNEITKTYATKAELKTTNDSLGTTAVTANDAKSKVDKIISGGTKAGKATHADTATTAKNLEDAPYLQDGDNNSIKLNVGGKTSNSYIVPYATTADKASKDGSGKVISDTYATKDELNDKLNASDAMVLAGSISGTGVIQKHNDNVVTQNVKDGTTNISALTDYKAGWTWRVVSDGTITGIGKVESGDMVMCVSDYNSAYKASDWTAIQRNIDLATANSSGLMSATDKANLDAALIQLDGIDTKINNIEGDITNINNDLTNTYATKTEMGAVEDKADAAQSTANEAKSTANSLVNGTTKAKKAGTADSATKATQDGNGKVISDTYALRGEYVATQDLGKYVPVNKHNGGVLAFPLATQSAGGAMSSDDKKKLDDTEGTYYSSFNVTGSGWYRLVNVPVAKWLDKYLVVDIVNAAGSAAHNSFKIYYNSPMGWGDERSNSFICAPLTRANTQCVGDVRLVYKGGASQYIDVYIILPLGTTNLKVSIKSNINSQYLAKNPVGADGKEGVAEAVLIALPDGYGSIVRNAYVGYTDDVSKRVVGGLFSERALQDINGNRIDAQYATKTEMNSYLPKTLAPGGYINTHQESSNAQFIPFFQNEFAHLIERGGSVSVAINGTEYTREDNAAGDALERKKFFDGCNSYYEIWPSSLGLQDTVTITIDTPDSYGYSGTIYCLMPNSWRGKNVKFELFYPSLNNGAGEWHTMYEGTNLSDGLVYQPIKTLYDANGNILVSVGTAWNKLRVTMTNFTSTSITLRIAEIGYVSLESKNSTAICLPRNGGEIYGGITPLNDSSYDLGANDKAWKDVFASRYVIKRADGAVGFIGVNNNNIAVFSKNNDDTKVFVFDEANRSFRRGYNAPDMILGTNTYPWKNMYGEQLTSTVADGTAPLVVRSKTMVDNLNAEMVGGVNADSIVYNKNNLNIELGQYYKLFSFRRSYQKGDISFQVSGIGDGGYFFATFLINFSYTPNLDDSTYLKINCLESYGKDLSQKVTATRRTTDKNGNTIVAGFDIWLDTTVTSTVFSVRVLSDSNKWSYRWIDREIQKVDSLPTAVYTSSWGVNLGVIDGAHKILGESSNAPLNVGNYFTPVYFNGGVPTNCNISVSGNRWGALSWIDTSGYTHIGKILAFNTTDANTSADVVVTARDANDADEAGLTIEGNTIASGKFAQYSGCVFAKASLSSYWVKLWSCSVKRSNTERNIIMLVAGRGYGYTNIYGIINIKIRLSNTTVTNNGVTTVTVVPSLSLKQIVGNINISDFKLYYKVVSDDKGNISQGDFELWCSTGVAWGHINAVILNSSEEGGVDNNAYKGTFFKNSFYTVQTPTLTDYVEMTNMEISQTTAKATNATNANFAEIVKSVAVPTENTHALQYVSGGITKGDDAGNSKEGSNADPNLWSYPKSGTMVGATTANIQTIRFKWNDSYFHDLFMSPNNDYLWHRHINVGNPTDWMKIVEATEDGKVVIEGTTYEDTLRIKNSDQSTGEIHIFNGEQGNAVIRHYEGSQTTDLKFNSTQVMHGSKALAYSSDVTALQTEIANLKKTVQEQATLIEALQSALTWE